MTIFTALSEPGRLRIVELLRRGPRTVGGISARLGIAQPQVSKHLRTLRGAGLVRCQPRAQERVYHLAPAPLRELDDWLAPYRTFWNQRLDALEARLASLPTPPRRRP